MTRNTLLLLLISLPVTLNAQWLSVSPPGPDYCSGVAITYTYYPSDSNNTITWYVDDFGPFSWSGTPATMVVGTGPVFNTQSYQYSTGIRVRAQETDTSGLFQWEAYDYAVSLYPMPIPVYYSYSGCGSLAAADPFDGGLSPQRWSMWYRDGIPTGWSQAHLQGPLPGGTYQYKLTLGCAPDTMASDPISIGGIPQPQVTASGPTTFCDGDSVILTLQPGFSVWNWQKNGVGIPGTGSMTSLTVKTSGNYTVQVYSQSGGGGNCFQISTPISVTVNPAAIISAPTVACSGDTVTLICTPASSYEWKRYGTVIPGATSQYLQVTQGGNYKVTTTGLTCNVSDVHNLQYYAVPSGITISQQGVITHCKYEATTLTVTGNNMTSWSWLRNGVAMPGSNAPTITATKPGNYKCVVSNLIGCSKTSQVAKLTTPVANDLPTKTVTIKPGPAGADSYTTCAFGNFTTNFGNAASMEVSAWFKHFRTAERGYLKFDLSGIPPQSPIVSSTLKLYADTAVVYQNGTQFLIAKRLTESWLENTISWVNAPDSTGFQPSSIPVTGALSNSTVSISVTDMARHWSFLPAENHGMLLHMQEYTSLSVPAGWMSFYSGDHAESSARPKLTVKYSYADISENGPLSFCAGGSVMFSTNPGYNYQWYQNNIAIAGANASNYTATTAGDYFVILSNAAGCDVQSATRTVTIPCRETQPGAAEILIIHQPNSDEIRVLLPAAEGEITLYDMTGSMKSVYSCREKECTINTNQLSPGVYVVHVSSGNVVKTGKVVVAGLKGG